MRTAAVEGVASVRSDTAVIPSHVADFGQGRVIVAPAVEFAAGIFTGEGDHRVVMVTLISGDGPLGLSHALSPADARTVAKALVAAAAQLEREAARDAAAALKRARRR